MAPSLSHPEGGIVELIVAGRALTLCVGADKHGQVKFQRAEGSSPATLVDCRKTQKLKRK